MATQKMRAGDSPLKKAINVGYMQAWFSPVTKHGPMLEFVLEHADVRNNRPSRVQLQPQGRTFTSYSESLWDMLNKEFVRNPRIRVVERQEYGELSFCLEATGSKELEKALLRCAKVCSRWVNKYRINEMLPA